MFTLQQIPGYTTLDMVRRYINLTSAHVMAQHNRLSPVNRMNIRQIETRTISRTTPYSGDLSPYLHKYVLLQNAANATKGTRTPIHAGIIPAS